MGLTTTAANTALGALFGEWVTLRFMGNQELVHESQRAFSTSFGTLALAEPFTFAASRAIDAIQILARDGQVAAEVAFAAAAGPVEVAEITLELSAQATVNCHRMWQLVQPERAHWRNIDG